VKESQLGFRYTWADLQPVRVLALTVAIAQGLGAFVGLWFPVRGDHFLGLWVGAAVAILPAFLLGAALQSKLHPGSLGENRVMVRRLGMLALLFLVVGFAVVLHNPHPAP
jgi:hypothetical protein